MFPLLFIEPLVTLVATLVAGSSLYKGSFNLLASSSPKKENGEKSPDDKRPASPASPF